jgi:hypothetical protein
MKTFQAVFNDSVEGVFGISLVEDPAMEGQFIALKKHEIQLKEIDKEQRILMGLVLEPNKPVYRNQNGEEFNIVFNEDTIKDLSYHFFKNNNQKNSSIEPEEEIQGVTFTESWIVEDPKIDKSAIHGFSYPKGSWVAVMKVDNDEVWNDYVKTGKVLGFSIDAMLSLKEVNLKSDIMSEVKKDQKSFMAELKALLGLNKPETKEVKFGSVKSAEGDITFEYDGETPVAGAAVWVMAEDGSKVPVPAGEYPLEGEMVLTVSEEGIIAAVGKGVEDGLENDAPGTAPDSILNQVQEQIKSLTIKYDKHIEENDLKISETEQKLADLLKENVELKKEVLELKEQPAAQKTILVTEQVALNKNGRLLSKLRNN